MKKAAVVLGVAGTILLGGGIFAGITYWKSFSWESPEELLTRYMRHIPQAEYEEMYEMVDAELSGGDCQG